MGGHAGDAEMNESADGLDLGAVAAPPHAKQSLRLWLRLLATTRLVEKSIRSYLRQECDSTLPRFDVLAALDRAPGKLTMGELSSRLLVSNGNSTGLVARLHDAGLVFREVDSTARRSQVVSLTPRGRAAFQAMAKQHEDLVDRIFSDLSDAEMERLLRLVTRLYKSASGQLDSLSEAGSDP
jgi:DNA-binding MarR family transcriptional regulator